jgi:RNA polymerase sigma-70 factor (ECF subfamily)
MSNLQKHSERELADLLQRGIVSVQGEVYARYANYLTAVCMRYIDKDEDVRDVLQESFIKIFTKASGFSYMGEGSFKAWMTKIVVNEALQHLRSEKQHGLVMEDEAIVPDPEIEIIERPDLANVPIEVLMDMIRKLPPGYRMVFNLYAIEGRRHKEIAELLGIQEQTSASQLYRARRLLASWIKEYVIKKQGPK